MQASNLNKASGIYATCKSLDEVLRDTKLQLIVNPTDALVFEGAPQAEVKNPDDQRLLENEIRFVREVKEIIQQYKEYLWEELSYMGLVP